MRAAMSGEVLAGVVGAWAVSQAALGIYFLMAYALGRRDRELLLFSLLCFALCLASVGVSIDFFSVGQEDYAKAVEIVEALVDESWTTMGQWLCALVEWDLV